MDQQQPEALPSRTWLCHTCGAGFISAPSDGAGAFAAAIDAHAAEHIRAAKAAECEADA